MKYAWLLVLLPAAAFAACGGGDGGGGAGTPTPPLDAGAEGGTVMPQSLCPNGVPVARPPGPYGTKILQTVSPDTTFDSPDGPVRMLDFFEPCATQSRLVAFRTGAAWCGTCAWSIANTSRLFGSFGSRIELVDLLIADEDNMPPDADALARWRARIQAPGKTALDPAFTFGASVFLPNAPLPQIVLVDTRTLQLRNAISPGSPEELVDLIAIELADLDKTPRPDQHAPHEYDGVFTDTEADLLRGMKLDDVPPADPTNEYGDVAAAADLGKLLFSDGTLSPAGKSCASCHLPGMQFADGLPQSTGGVSPVDRNSPDIALSAFARWQFWDGRADTLWAQALGPPENPREIGSTRLFIAHRVSAVYASQYAAVFGAKYPLPANLDSLPSDGKPGDAAYDAMAQADKDAVTRVYVNVGKAIAAFERSIRVQTNRLDAYAGGDTTALSNAEKQSLKAYFISGCAQCHWGPRLTDDAFHVIRMPTGRQDHAADPGRGAVLATLATSEFVASSQWSDAPASAKRLAFGAAPLMNGAFKTPSLRGVANTAPYGHGGTLAQLSDVARHYGTRGVMVSTAQAVGTIEQWLPEFDQNAQQQLPAFLNVLTADPIP